MDNSRPNIPHDDRSALDKLEHTLYDPKAKIEDIHLHHVKDTKSGELPTSWGDNSPLILQAHDDHGTSFGVKLLIFSTILLILALAFTGWRVFSLRNVVSSASIDLTGDISPFVEGGASTPLKVSLFNKNTSPLEEAVLTLMYKQGISAQDEQEKIQEKRVIGTIKPSEYKYQDFDVILYGSESEARDLTLKLEYKVAGSNAVFSKVVTTGTVLKTPPISVRVNGPQVLSVGQSGTFDIVVKNNSATTSLPSVLQLTLPTTFTTINEEPKSTSKGPTWAIKPLAPGDSEKVSLTGSVLGTQGETVTMRAVIGSQGERVSSVGVVYASQTADIKLRSSPLAVSLSLETDTGVSETLRYGDNAVLSVTYTNAGEAVLHDASFKLLLEGDAPLFKQVRLDESGFYDSVKQTITWDSTSAGELASLAPGASRTFKVTIPVVTKGTNSPKLKASLTGSASDTTTEGVTVTTQKTWVVQGSATLSAQTRYKNTELTNNGPVPPLPNTETTYTARFTVSAQNALVNTLVAFTLPTYVTWKQTTTDSAKVTYDSRSKTVTWNLGTLEAGKTATIEMMLGVKPSQSHVGQTPAITSGIILDTDEQISGAHIRTTVPALTIKLNGESWPEDPSRVVDR